jgi:DNA-binding winged helix-turn-helix (wHTH) protein
MMQITAMLYRFEAFELDTEQRDLRRAGKTVPLEPQVFDLLQFLTCNRQRVVTKDDIIASVWGGRIVSESTLTSRINSARTAIGDSGKTQRLIKTMRHRGVRFIGSVTESGGSGDVPLRAAEPAIDGAELNNNPSIVVLPFLNLSGDPAQEYFADGMVEDITMELGRLPWLFVIASASAFTDKGRNISPRQVAAELGVRYVLRAAFARRRTVFGSLSN